MAATKHSAGPGAATKRAPLWSDGWLAPYFEAVKGRALAVDAMADKLTGGHSEKLADFASGHEYFGLHFRNGRWSFREWAPNATRGFLIGDFSNWEKRAEFELHKRPHGVWTLSLPGKVLRHGMHYLLYLEWPGGSGTRLPAWTRRVEQDEKTHLFTAIVHHPAHPYVFRYPVPPAASPLIYESHVGMAQEEPKVGTFEEYRTKILPLIAAKGYNTVQLMAVMEHPYYGSFGYHVSNLFAVSSRFGSPEDFKALVDEAHRLGLRVIMDIVHSHCVRNENEGLAKFDGTRSTYFHAGPRGEHPAWDSLCYNYAKGEVLHYLLSNCRFWLDEYHVDGFRFDGVTSMLYFDHGLGRAFTGYGDYFSGNFDQESFTYLALANRVIHAVRPDAVTIAEDVSGLPGLCAPQNECGAGFDYRLAMGVTDHWFKLFDRPDETWSMGELFHVLTDQRADEQVISYAECHDQAIVGGQSAFFRLAGDAIYDSMHNAAQNLAIDRAMALHKMMRLATFAAAGDGYLNFMGNEFGHPEWIDFPREGNGWSMDRARRQWHLSTDPGLKFRFLEEFDHAMLKIAAECPGFFRRPVQLLRLDEEKKIIAFERSGYCFFFNFHPTGSFAEYGLEVPAGRYETVIDSDDPEFGGFARRTRGQSYTPLATRTGQRLYLYLPNRTALVLKRTVTAKKIRLK